MMASESQVPAKPESGSRKAGHLRPPEQNPKCPRCGSPSTKFCYYNNYSLSQPRHFCKTCRRYWTRGGALRNIPIGGGCRKNKKIKSNSRLSNNPSLEFHPLGCGTIQDTGTSSIITTTTTNSPSLNLNSTCYNIDTSMAGSSSLMGFNNYYGNSVLQQSGETGSLINAGAHQEMASMNFNTNNLASSIESLSCFNQDLHWKLQQQRINSLLLNEENQKEPSALFENQLVRKLDPISFGGNTTNTNQWVFDNSFNPTTNTLSTTNNNSGSGGGNTNNNWSGFQGWSSTEWNQYSGTGTGTGLH